MTITSFSSLARGTWTQDGVYYGPGQAIQAPVDFVNPIYSATSATSARIGTGVQTFTVERGRAFSTGSRVRATSRESGFWLEGTVIAYVATLLTVQILETNGIGVWDDWNISLIGEYGRPPPQPSTATNFSFVESHAGNAVTFSLMTVESRAFSDFDMMQAVFPDGTISLISTTPTLTIPAGTNLGVSSPVPFRAWIIAYYDTTLKLAAMQSRVLSNNQIKGFAPNGFLKPAQFGDGAGLVYASSPPASTVPFIVLGCAEYDSGLATPGNWAVSPTRMLLFGSGMRLPGQELQTVGNVVATKIESSEVIPIDGTAPQVTEGGQYLIQAIVPHSRFSVMEIDCLAMLNPNQIAGVTSALFRTTTTDALAVVSSWSLSFGLMYTHRLYTRVFEGATSSVSYAMRAGRDAASGVVVVSMNGDSTLSWFGGRCGSYIRVTELMT